MHIFMHAAGQVLSRRQGLLVTGIWRAGCNCSYLHSTLHTVLTCCIWTMQTVLKNCCGVTTSSSLPLAPAWLVALRAGRVVQGD